MLGNTFQTFAELNTFVTDSPKVSVGKYFVSVDETKNGVPTEYYVDSNKNISLMNETTLINSDIF